MVGIATRLIMLILIVLVWSVTNPIGISNIEAMVRLIMYVVLIAFVVLGSEGADNE